MAHFNQRQGLFQSKKDILQYVNDDPREYIPYILPLDMIDECIELP